jgi:hypothetical protein
LDFVNQTADKENKGMAIDAIMVGDQAISYTHQNDEIILDLPSPSTKNQTIIFTIKYHGVPLDGLRIGKTKLGDRSFFNENWPNRARHWLPTLDHPSDKATSEFKGTHALKVFALDKDLRLHLCVQGAGLKHGCFVGDAFQALCGVQNVGKSG